MTISNIYLIPTVLHEDEQALKAIPSYILDAVQKCDVFYVENEKTARRFLKKIWREMVIDNYEWIAIHKVEEEIKSKFVTHIRSGKNIGILSEAGCPGVADPGQLLVEVAQREGVKISPLVGPSSILLALMASGMNGQHFQFHGYLPIDSNDRKKEIKELENESAQKGCTQIFIETPYRNNQMIKELLQSCKTTTKLCIATNITSAGENIQTKTIAEWQKATPDIHKQLAIFLLHC